MSVLLSVRNLKKHFQTQEKWNKQRVIYAVDGVSFDVRKGETFGLVGESGCGKTTTGRLILRLLEPTAGHIDFNGNAVLEMDRQQLKRLRRDMQMYLPAAHKLSDAAATFVDFALQFVKDHDPNTLDSATVAELAPPLCTRRDA